MPVFSYIFTGVVVLIVVSDIFVRFLGGIVWVSIFFSHSSYGALDYS